MYRSSPIMKWRLYNDRYQLEGNKCVKCGKMFYPKAFLCSCGSREFHKHVFSGQGKLVSFTEIKTPPEKFSDYAPFCIGLVELTEGPRILAQIADADFKDLSLGLEMQASFRKFYASGESGIIHYGLKFAPAFQRK